MRMLASSSLVLLLLVGCDEPRRFDERYSDTANVIQNRADSIEADLEGSSNSSPCSAGNETDCK